MLEKSSPFVKIDYFDRKIVEEALQKYLKELREGHPEVKRVILFGSFVRGESVPGSDIDLLIVLEGSTDSLLARIPRYLPSHFPVGVDVFPYTEEELAKMKDEGNFLIKRALEEGIEVLHRK